MTLFRNLTRVSRLGAMMLVPVGLMVGCTDLKETPTSLITKDTFYKNSDEVIAGLAAVYANLRSQYDQLYSLNQVSSEETVVPVRGSDWFDNGQWLELHRQGWTPSSTVGNGEVTGIWNAQYAGVARANVVLEALNNVTIPNQAAIKAELRVLRARFYLDLMDCYGGVPIATDTKVEERPRKTRAEVFTFIETELKAARADLPKTWADQQGRVTRGVADAMLASLYLNAQIWSGTPTATGITPGTAKWTEAAAFATASSTPAPTPWPRTTRTTSRSRISPRPRTSSSCAARQLMVLASTVSTTPCTTTALAAVVVGMAGRSWNRRTTSSTPPTFVARLCWSARRSICSPACRSTIVRATA